MLTGFHLWAAWMVADRITLELERPRYRALLERMAATWAGEELGRV